MQTLQSIESARLLDLAKVFSVAFDVRAVIKGNMRRCYVSACIWMWQRERLMMRVKDYTYNGGNFDRVCGIDSKHPVFANVIH